MNILEPLSAAHYNMRLLRSVYYVPFITLRLLISICFLYTADPIWASLCRPFQYTFTKTRLFIPVYYLLQQYNTADPIWASLCSPLQYARWGSARRATRVIPRPSISTANSLAGLAGAGSKRRWAAGRRWRASLRWPSAAFCDLHAYARRWRGTAFGAGLWLSATAGHNSLSYLGLTQHGAYPI